MVRSFSRLLLALVVCTIGLRTAAAEPSESVLPPTTKGFVAIPDFDELMDKWNGTQLGKLAKDPLMKPFVDEIERQLRGTLLNTSKRFGIELNQLRGVYGGEISMAIIQPDNAQNEHAVAMLVDVRGHMNEARALIENASNRQLANGGQRSMLPTQSGATLTVVTLPDDPQHPGRTAYYGLHNDRLLVADHRQVAEDILERMHGRTSASLATQVAFQRAMEHCTSDNESATEHARWFIEPFGFTETVRSARGGVQRRGNDMLKMLANQGFTAVQGVGGRVFLGTGDHDVMHRTFVYAPAAPRNEVEKPTDKYKLAARMLDFPNSQDLQPEDWVPANVTNYLSFNWKMKEAFEYSRTLVNEMMGEEVFEEILKNIETDPNGPQVNIRRDIIGQFQGRVSVFADHKLPTTPTSERLLVAIRVNDPDAVLRTIARAMQADTQVKIHEAGKHVIWEMSREEVEEDEIPDLMIDGPFGFGPALEEESVEGAEEEADEPVVPNFSVTVAHGHLLVSNQPDYLAEVLQLPTSAPKLKDAADYKAVNAALNKLGADATSCRFFVRSDRACQPTYDMLRAGRMPESESVIGKVLNRVLGSQDKDAEPREQQLNGDNMPAFDQIRHYFTPAGFFVHSHDEGWLISGCLLN